MNKSDRHHDKAIKPDQTQRECVRENHEKFSKKGKMLSLIPN